MRIQAHEVISRFMRTDKFREWLVTKGDETFDYFSNGECCLAQWAKECGATTWSVGGVTIIINQLLPDRHTIPVPCEYNDLILDNSVNRDEPVPFSQILKLYDAREFIRRFRNLTNGH